MLWNDAKNIYSRGLVHNMVVRAEHMNCRRNIIDNAGNWTVEKMCNDCQTSLFIRLMISAECGNIRDAKAILERTAERLD